MLRALLVEDDRVLLPALVEIVEREGFSVSVADSLAQARVLARELQPQLLLVDFFLPDGSGMELVAELSAETTMRIILITGHASMDSAVEALRLRTFDYLTKPLDMDRLQRVLRHVRLEALHTDTAGLVTADGAPAVFGPLVGGSVAMGNLYRIIEKVAPTDASVLIYGESGTGKDLVGRVMHELSTRRDRPYLALNCGALTPALIGSELFGHEKGSFTGANRRHIGYFERASGGTLFLDEVTEMPADLQVNLLRVLETGKLVRLGGDREIEVDVRVIAATNRKVDAAMVNGAFRKDLFFRLAGFPIDVPPLRERDGDIELLARHFLAALNRENDTRRFLDAAAVATLNAYSWPGNVRELKHHIMRAYVMCGADRMTAADLQVSDEEWQQSLDGTSSFMVGDSLEDVERKLIYATLKCFRGNKRRTAQALGLSLKTIYNRLNQYERDGISG